MNKVTTGLLTALLLASAMAGAETQKAVNFEPVIIYQDTDYIAKHSRAKISSAPTAQARLEAVETKSKNSAQPDDSLAQNYWLGLVVLALGGLIFWSSSRPGSQVQEIRYDSTVILRGSATETGVAKYLKSLDISAKGAAAVTGVARYLKNQELSAAVTGVARYLKSR